MCRLLFRFSTRKIRRNLIKAVRTSNQLKNLGLVKRGSVVPFAPAVLRTASAHYISLVPENSPSPKGSKQSVHSVTPFRLLSCFHSSTKPLIPAPFRSFVHTLFAYTRKLARGHSASGTGSNASTVSPVAACICFAVALRFVGCLFPQAGIFIRVHFLPSANIVF